MAVKIRIARFGCRNRPFFRIIVSDSKTPRDGKPIQVVGFYDPLSGKDGGNKYIGLKYDAVKYLYDEMIPFGDHYIELHACSNRQAVCMPAACFFFTRNITRIGSYWLSVGAQPSDPVRRILLKAGLLSPSPMAVMADKRGPIASLPVVDPNVDQEEQSITM